MTIDINPFYKERKYWGFTNVEGIISAYYNNRIDFTITKWESTLDIDQPQEGMKIEITIKNSDFKPFRGKDKIKIFNAIKEEIKLQNITL